MRKPHFKPRRFRRFPDAKQFSAIANDVGGRHITISPHSPLMDQSLELILDIVQLSAKDTLTLDGVTFYGDAYPIIDSDGNSVQIGECV